VKVSLVAYKRQAALGLWLVWILPGAGCARQPRPRELTLAAAADLNFAMQDIARRFQAQRPGVDVRVTYGSSGNFYSQIRNGAPFDIFLSADMDYPRRLAGSRGVFVYARGRLAVWVPAGSRLDPATALRDPSVRHIALANPRHAPYGRAAVAALRTLGLYDALAPKLVMGENVAQALEFAQSRAAEVGIVALALVVAPGPDGTARAPGRYWEIPPDDYPRLEQGAVVLKDSPAARAFRGFLLGPQGRAILKQYGFSE
jgi:molybdate transport system substrate-binding protein